MRITGPRARALKALQMAGDQNRALTSAEVARLSGHGTAASMSDVLRALYRSGAVSKKGRPSEYEITGKGLIAIGSFPSKKEKPA